VNSLVPSGTGFIVPSGTRPTCHQGPESLETPRSSEAWRARNFSNKESFGFFLTGAPEPACCCRRPEFREPGQCFANWVPRLRTQFTHSARAGLPNPRQNRPFLSAVFDGLAAKQGLPQFAISAHFEASSQTRIHPANAKRLERVAFLSPPIHETRHTDSCGSAGSECLSLTLAGGCGASVQGSASSRSADYAAATSSLSEDLPSVSASLPHKPRRIARALRSASRTRAR
jgi:hypothetical protein